MRKGLVFDVETGGLDPYSNGVMSVTLKVLNEDVIKTIYVKPQERLKYDSKALDVNGISLEFLRDHGCSETDAIQQIKSFIDDNYTVPPEMIGHNLIFDVQFLNAMFKRNGESYLFSAYMHYHPIDTMIFMKLLKHSGVINPRSISLINSYKYFHGHAFDDAHSSDADVLATEKLYNKIMDFVSSRCAVENE